VGLSKTTVDGVSPGHELEVVVEAVRAAAAAIVQARRRGLVLDRKQGNEVVTDADRDADRLIRAAIQATFPHDLIYSEEGADPVERHHAERVWVVDPLDGTGSSQLGWPSMGTPSSEPSTPPRGTACTAGQSASGSGATTHR
jgi:fructose-1,6-bisphosphatase